MPVKGKILTNPLTGDTYEFLETEADTNGKHVSIKATIKSKGQLVPDHIHVLQDENFEIISGELTIKQNGKTQRFGEGESVFLPKMNAHNHYNENDTPVIYIHKVTPALDFDYFIEGIVGLAADGKSKNGRYGLLQELVSLKYIDSKAYLADIPLGVQKFMMNTIGPIGRLMGYRAIYKKYSGIEK